MCIHHKETTIKALRELADAFEYNECPRETLLYVINSLSGVVAPPVPYTDAQGHTYPMYIEVDEDAIHHSIEDPWDEAPGDYRENVLCIVRSLGRNIKEAK